MLAFGGGLCSLSTSALKFSMRILSKHILRTATELKQLLLYFG